jgi:hypothetical protein
MLRLVRSRPPDKQPLQQEPGGRGPHRQEGASFLLPYSNMRYVCVLLGAYSDGKRGLKVDEEQRLEGRGWRGGRGGGGGRGRGGQRAEVGEVTKAARGQYESNQQDKGNQQQATHSMQEPHLSLEFSA